MQGYPPNPPPGGGYPPPGGSPYGYGPPPPGGFGGPPGMPMAPMVSPQAPYGIEPMTGLPYSDKSRVVAGVLQIFLGWCGAGRFYTGHMGLAVLQLLFGWLTCGIWPLIDGIMMLTGKVPDAQGRPLREG